MFTGKQKVLTATVAALLGAASVLATPSAAFAYDDDDAGGCGFLGCGGGGQLCADYGAQVNIPGVGNVTVKYYCYQAMT